MLKPSPLHSSREWRVCIGAEREYSLSLDSAAACACSAPHACLHCWNCIQICHLLVWPISSSMHYAFSEKKGQKWWKITIHDLGLQDTPSVFCQKKEQAGGAIPQIKSAKMHRAVKISQLINQFHFWYRKT